MLIVQISISLLIIITLEIDSLSIWLLFLLRMVENKYLKKKKSKIVTLHKEPLLTSYLLNYVIIIQNNIFIDLSLNILYLFDKFNILVFRYYFG